MRISKKAITRMQSLIIVAIIVIALIAGVAYYYVSNLASPSPTTQYITIGSIQQLSGAGTRMGIPAEHGIQLAFAAINNAGGITINGTKYFLRTSTKDSGSTSTGAVAAAHLLIDQEGVKIIHGEDTSTYSLAVMQITQPAKVIQITEVSAALSLINAGDPYFFRATYSAQMSARADMLTMQKLGLKHVGFCGDDSAATISQRDSMIAAGVTANITVDYQTFPAGTTDWTPYLSALKAKNLDAIRCYMYNTGDQLAATTAWLSLGMTPWFFGAVKEAGLAVEPNGTRQNYIQMTNLTKLFGCDGEWNFSDPVALNAIAYVTQLDRATYNEAPSETTFRGWDCGFIIAQALQAAQTFTDTDVISQAMGNTVYGRFLGMDMIRFMPQTFSKVHWGQLVEPLFSFNVVLNATGGLAWTYGGTAVYQDY